MHLDHGYFIGNGHLTCQDYALTSKSIGKSDFDWGLCGDGCSGAKFSEVGVRVLLHHLAPLMGEEPNIQKAINLSFDTCMGMGLPEEALLASVVGIQLLQPNLVRGFVCGDGVVGVQTPQKDLLLFIVENHSDQGSFPFYPAYFGYHRRYTETIGTETAKIRGVWIAPNQPPQPLKIIPNEEIVLGGTKIRCSSRCEISEMKRAGQPIQFQLEIENPFLVGGFSDGVLTGRNPNLSQMDEFGLLRELFQFHSNPVFFQGRFFHRRAKQALRTIIPEDDLSGIMMAFP